VKNTHITASDTFAELTAAVTDAVTAASDVDPRFGDRVVPLDLRRFLARLRLLELVPFAYLVADSELLPPESIRYFHLDRAWADSLVEGALSVGTVSSADRAQLEQLHAGIRAELDEEERLVRMVGAGPAAAAAGSQGAAGPITGFLLRSRAVSSYPGLHVRAYSRDVVGDEEVVDENHPDRLRLLRLERLAPAVLLALFDGVPEIVHLEEPRVGIQFGVRLAEVGGDPNRLTATIPVRNATTAATTADPPVAVSFRRGSPGVLDLRGTANAFPAVALHDPPPGDGPGGAPEMDGAELALQAIRFPYRQVFGDPGTAPPPIGDVFRPTLAHTVTNLVTTFTEAVDR
jgi:hypothetical protein